MLVEVLVAATPKSRLEVLEAVSIVVTPVVVFDCCDEFVMANCEALACVPMSTPHPV